MTRSDHEPGAAPAARLTRLLSSALLAGLATIAATSVQACGIDTDCRLDARSYRIALPTEPDPNAALGALVFAHGYRGSAAGTMQNARLAALADRLGIAVVAADAGGPDWQLPGAPSFPGSDGAATLAYFDSLRRNLTERFDVDPERIVASGFSSGGMLVWHLACHRGDVFRGFVPLSGTFWEPLPRACPTTAVDLVHYHGTDDSVVPLDGRPIGDSRQGKVSEAMALFAESGGYRAVASPPEPGLDCGLAMNESGQRLELCLFAGGHSYAVAHLVRALGLFGLVPAD
jgi:polyhydroxybutyrate depolymerase